MKKALLIISHGSRRAASNEEVLALTGSVRELSAGLVGHASRIRERVMNKDSLIVECAFLEITEPTVQQKIDALAASGVTDIQVFPHFLAAGAHVTSDIPREIEAARQKHPAISFEILPHLGSLPELTSIILETVKAHS